MIPVISGQDDPTGSISSAIAKLKQEMIELQNEAAKAAEFVSRTASTVASKMAGIGGGGTNTSSGGVGGQMHTFYQLHALTNVLQGNISPHAIRSVLALGTKLGGDAGKFATSALGAASMAFVPALVTQQLMEAVKAGYEMQKQTAQSEVQGYTSFLKKQRQLDNSGMNIDVLSMHQGLLESGFVDSKVGSSITERMKADFYNFLGFNDADARKASSEKAQKALKIMERAQKLYGGNLNELAKKFDVRKWAFDPQVIAMREKEKKGLPWFDQLALKLPQGRVVDYARQKELALDRIEGYLAREETMREQDLQQHEKDDPSFRAVQKQTWEYLRVVEEESFKSKQQWNNF